MEKREMLKRGFGYVVFSTLVIAIQFVNYLLKSPQLELMDFTGWVFFLTAALSHAALFALLPYLLVYLPLILLTAKEKLASIVHVLLMAFLNVIACLNGMVFSLYKFHLNGFVLDLYFGEGGDEIFNFDTSIYLYACGVVLFFLLLNLFLSWLSGWLYAKRGKAYVLPSVLTLVGLLLVSNLMHAYAAVAQLQSVKKSATHLPYYFPLTANRFMIRMGVVAQEDLVSADFGTKENTTLAYPRQELISDSVPLKNVVLIAIDSWNYLSFTEEVMPNVTAFADKNVRYENHLSSSNGTRGSIFGLFFSASSYYWNDFDVSGVTPVLVDELAKRNYNIQAFPSATLNSPNFAKLLFYKVKGIRHSTEGVSVYDRDCQLTKDFVEYLDQRDTSAHQPFFSFLFYDLAHAIEYPKDKPKRFLPSWDYSDYVNLSNDMDPLPFWNLYRNSVSAVDSLVGVVLRKLEEEHLLDETVIVITGDHGQEFNENHKNYWGHGSNYSPAQIHVPFVYHYPQAQPSIFTYRTTHYDFSPTILHDVLGVKNAPSDYSMGKLLSDTTFRDWHIVGDNLNYAFIVEDDVIIEKKPSGYLEITDARLNPIEGYKINSKELNVAISKLNMFYK
ncbi:MAG: DUF3413 domain-containing protein [Paludibacteraceae bacterium]|nr:DUF3413 domain-containing protein [Paludibacteraceae bacterium]